MTTTESLSPDWSDLTPCGFSEVGSEFLGLHGNTPARFLRLTDVGRGKLVNRGRLAESWSNLPGKRILDGRLQDQAWVAVEEPLGTLLSHPPDSAMMAARHILALTQQLISAHGLGFIHGDVRPGSVTIEPDGTATLSFLDVTIAALPPESDPYADLCLQDTQDPRPAARDAVGLGGVILACLDTCPDPDGPEGARLRALAESLRAIEGAISLEAAEAELLAILGEPPLAKSLDDGSRVGRFALVEDRGARDGFESYFAVDLESREEVLLRLWPLQSAIDALALAEFHARGQEAQDICHPALPKLLQVGHDVWGAAHGSLFLASERPRGTGLGEGTRSEETNLRLLAELASGIGTLHESGIAMGVFDADAITIDHGIGRWMHHGLLAEIEHVTPSVDLKAFVELFPRFFSTVPASVSRIAERVQTGALASMRDLAEELFGLAGSAKRDFVVHPEHPPKESSTLSSRVELELRASPAELWPHVSNSERLNRAVGLGAVEEWVEVEGGEPRRMGRARQAGFSLVWHERPFEWVLGRRMGVVRTYQEGPLRWLRSVVELIPEGSGTRLIHSLEADPRGVLARAAASVEMGVRSKRALEKAYRRLDAFLNHELPGKGAVPADPWEDPNALSADAEKLLVGHEQKLRAGGASPKAIQALLDAIRYLPGPELARMRPIALARRLDVEEQEMITACFLGAASGLLVPGWEPLCPGCRAPTDLKSALRDVEAHGRCEVCAMSFDLDLSASIELVFQPSEAIRVPDRATYCISSPAHSPHVAAQVNVAPGERLDLAVTLGVGHWQVSVRGEHATPIRVDPSHRAQRLEVRLSQRGQGELVVGQAPQILTLWNDTTAIKRVRMEAAAGREDILTAAKALTHPLFTTVFPGETIRPGTMLRASMLVFVALGSATGSGDLTTVYDQIRTLEGVASKAGGTAFRLHGTSVVCAFESLRDAMTAAFEVVASGGRACLEMGVSAATTLNQRMDYLGEAAAWVADGLRSLGPAELSVGPEVQRNPDARAFLSSAKAEEWLIDVAPDRPDAARFRVVEGTREDG